MKKNISALDKTFRISVAIAIIALYFLNTISGIIAVVLLIIAAIFIVTSLVNFCPLYKLLGVSNFNNDEQ